MQNILVNDYNILYLIQNINNGIIKIGVTNNIEKRIKLFQNICGMKLKLLKTYIIQNSFRVEKILHFKYKNKRTYGEWFKLNSDDLLDIDNIIKNIDNDFNNYNDIKIDSILVNLINKKLLNKSQCNKINILLDLIQYCEISKSQIT